MAVIGEFDSEAWDCLLAAQRAVTADGRTEIGSDDVLGALLDQDESGIVRQVVDDAGIALSQIRASLRSVTLSRSSLADGNHIQPNVETRAIMDSALSEARAREHLYVESGHLLLAILLDPACAAYRILVEAGADPDRLVSRLVALLPAKALTEEAIRRDSKRWPRLTAKQVRDLAHQHAAGREANRVLGLVEREARGCLAPGEEAVTLSSGERTQLERVREDTRGAWLRLATHHAYLAWTAARHCAAQGHDLGYCYAHANRALSGACLTYSPWHAEPLDEYAKLYIANCMSEFVGCELEDGWDTTMPS